MSQPKRKPMSTSQLARHLSLPNRELFGLLKEMGWIKRGSDGWLLTGKGEKSGRDGFVVYMGNDIFGVKWQDWKIHFKEQDAWNTIMRTYTMPRVFNLMNDPLEQDNVIFPHTWVLKAGLRQLEEHVASLKNYPPIPSGTPDPYEPQN